MSAELSIIIVNWNGGELLKRSIGSIERFPSNIPFELIVVDNASTDGSREWLNSQNNRLTVVANDENLGFARANNQAFTLTNSQLLFLLNSDAEVHEQTLDKLAAAIRSSARIGVVGPRLLNADGSLQASVWRNPPTPFETLSNAFRLYKLMPKRLRAKLLLGYHWDHSYRRSANLLSGAALMVKREVITQVGGFDERFHMYGEDTEWCLRVVRAGWEMMFEPAATVTHHGGASAAKRWSDLEKRRAEYLAFFQFQRMALSKRLVVGNLLSGLFTTRAQLFWRSITGRERDEPRMVSELFRRELHEVLRNKQSDANE